MDYILKTVDISPITLGRALTIVGSSLGLAVALMLVYMFTHRRTGWRPSIAMTMLMLGPIVSVIVLCIDIFFCNKKNITCWSFSIYRTIPILIISCPG